MDYPNSNKAKKVFLVLMVGSGGQIPQGIQGEAEGMVNEDQVKFERRRERAKVRSSVKKKNIKDRDWVLKKKEVQIRHFSHSYRLTKGSITSSCTDNEGKRTFLGIQSTPPGNERFASNLPGHRLVSTHPLIHHHVRHNSPGVRSAGVAMAEILRETSPLPLKR